MSSSNFPFSLTASPQLGYKSLFVLVVFTVEFLLSLISVVLIPIALVLNRVFLNNFNKYLNNIYLTLELSQANALPIPAFPGI